MNIIKILLNLIHGKRSAYYGGRYQIITVDTDGIVISIDGES